MQARVAELEAPVRELAAQVKDLTDHAALSLSAFALASSLLMDFQMASASASLVADSDGRT